MCLSIVLLLNPSIHCILVDEVIYNSYLNLETDLDCQFTKVINCYNNCISKTRPTRTLWPRHYLQKTMTAMDRHSVFSRVIVFYALVHIIKFLLKKIKNYGLLWIFFIYSRNWYGPPFCPMSPLRWAPGHLVINLTLQSATNIWWIFHGGIRSA